MKRIFLFSMALLFTHSVLAQQMVETKSVTGDLISICPPVGEVWDEKERTDEFAVLVNNNLYDSSRTFEPQVKIGTFFLYTNASGDIDHSNLGSVYQDYEIEESSQPGCDYETLRLKLYFFPDTNVVEAIR